MSFTGKPSVGILGRYLYLTLLELVKKKRTREDGIAGVGCTRSGSNPNSLPERCSKLAAGETTLAFVGRAWG